MKQRENKRKRQTLRETEMERNQDKERVTLRKNERDRKRLVVKERGHYNGFISLCCDNFLMKIIIS